jgi:flagellar motility protein MotE (MotC chaperone)
MKLLLCVSLLATLGKNLTASEEKKEAAKAEKKTEEAKAEGDKKSESKGEGAVAEGATAPEGTHKAETGAFPEKEFYTKAEVEALRQVLDEKSQQLDQDIDSQKKYIESLKVQVADHLKKIETARNEIADYMNTRDEKEESKLKKLAKFYEAMDAEQAAPLLKDVQDDLAIKIFDRMDAKKAGTILAQLPATRAARLTAAFPRLRLQADKSGSERQ